MARGVWVVSVSILLVVGGKDHPGGWGRREREAEGVERPIRFALNPSFRMREATREVKV